MTGLDPGQETTTRGRRPRVHLDVVLLSIAIAYATVVLLFVAQYVDVGPFGPVLALGTILWAPGWLITLALGSHDAPSMAMLRALILSLATNAAISVVLAGTLQLNPHWAAAAILMVSTLAVIPALARNINRVLARNIKRDDPPPRQGRSFVLVSMMVAFLGAGIIIRSFMPPVASPPSIVLSATLDNGKLAPGRIQSPHDRELRVRANVFNISDIDVRCTLRWYLDSIQGPTETLSVPPRRLLSRQAPWQGVPAGLHVVRATAACSDGSRLSVDLQWDASR